MNGQMSDRRGGRDPVIPRPLRQVRPRGGIESPPLTRGDRTRMRRRRKTWTVAIVATLGLFVLVGAWVIVRGNLAKNELEEALPLASQIQRQVLDGDTEGASMTLIALQARSSAARSLTSDPVWRLVEMLPWAGANFRAVRELAEVVDDITADAIAPLTTLANQLNPSDLRPANRTIALQPIIDAAPNGAAAALAIERAQQKVHSIRRDDVLDFVRRGTDELESSIDEVANAVSVVSGALELLPTMLGSEGPKSYLFLFQNPAELRSSGGIPGALALVKTENGRIDLVQQVSGGSFPEFDSPVLELPPETRSLFGDLVGEYMVDVTMAPQFTLAASLAKEMWSRQHGVDVDGVIAVDPVALGYLLEATGAIELPSGDELTATNAAQLLLSDVYWRYPTQSEQDGFFSTAASAVFDRVASGGADPARMIEAFAKSGAERRILIWLDDPKQEVLEGTTLAGGLPISDDEITRLGMYFNDATGSKMDYYLDRTISVGSAVCRNDGLRTVQVDLTLKNTAPEDGTLPDHVTGGGSFGVTPGNIRTLVALYGPPSAINQGAESVSAENQARPLGAHQTTDEGYPVTQVSVELKPGERQKVRYTMLLPATSANTIVVLPTPGVNLPVTEQHSTIC